ncbi:alpha/beta hydrolase [Haloferula sp.]|uniref:alpha/beta hydrolase n=1 Tax=Haloferula sp. TaxID=2497595 RepID=UPI00329CA9E4
MARLRKFTLRLLITTAILTLAALIGVGWFGSERLISPPRRSLQDYHREILSEPAQFGLAVTTFTGASGTPCLMVFPAESPGEARKSRQLRAGLRSRGIQPPAWGDIRGTVILLHGHSSRKEDHLPICERFCAAGFRCLLPDLPGHGENPSSLATFGKNESPLIERLLEDAEITFGFADQPAFLFGISQGGAIALQAAAKDSERWTAVASAAAFASLDRPILHSAKSFHHQLRHLAPINTFAVACGSWCRSGMWPASVSPRNAARQLIQPVMIIHGENDTFIQIDQGREIFDALPSPSKIFRPVANAGHGRVLAEDADNLYPEICAFFLQALDGTIASTF